MIRRLTVLAVAFLVVAVPLTANAETITRHRTYEATLTGFFGVECAPGYVLGIDDCDPTDRTDDGSIDVGAVRIPADGALAGATEVQVSIVDDVWGPDAVAGYVCALGTDDFYSNCGEQQSGYDTFCGKSEPVSPHTGEIGEVWVYVLGPRYQALFCDPAGAPTGGTSGGVLTDDGGIYAGFTVP